MSGRALSLATLVARLGVIRLRGHEFLFQREAEQWKRALAPERARRMLECVAAADLRFRLAGKISLSDGAIGTAILLRQQAILLLEAAAAAQLTGDEAERSTDAPTETKQEFLRLCAALEIPPDERDDGYRLLTADEPLAIDRLPRADLVLSARALESFCLALRERLEIRPVWQIVVSRWVRVSLAAILGGAFVFLVLRALVSPPNVARGKPVKLSALDARGAPEGALVDGVRSGEISPASPGANVVQSQGGPSPFATIDLLAPHALREILVYNRDDGYFDESLPYAVDISLDGTAFTEVAHRTTHFGSWLLDPPWTIPMQKQSARYVRVRATRYLALSEVEVRAW